MCTGRRNGMNGGNERRLGEDVAAAVTDLVAYLPSDDPVLAERVERINVALDRLLAEVGTRDQVEKHWRSMAETERDAASDLRAEAQARTAFLIALSHDLRAPVGALVHQAQLLDSGSLPEELRHRSASILQTNAAMLSRMMDDLIDIERFAHGELQLDRRPTSLSTVLSVIDRDDVEVIIDDPDASVWVDVDVMSRAIRTLVAVKGRRYPSSPVVVQGRLLGDEVEITVRAGSATAPPSEAPDASRAIDFRLIGALVEAHDGSVTPIDHGVILRLPTRATGSDSPRAEAG